MITIISYRMLTPVLVSIILFISMGEAAASENSNIMERLKQLEETQNNLNHVWTMMAAALVFFMQAGFLLLEAGTVRSKNSINVAQKNIADFVLSTVFFGMFGFMLMFGDSWNGLLGFDMNLFSFNKVDDWTFTFFVFQVVFCGTAATILSGSVAERMQFVGYLFATIFISAIIYPIFGHWAWGNLLYAENASYLADLGFIDFAGSTVVHSVGGWCALAACIVIGPRIGKFDSEGKPQRIIGHSPVLAAVGTIILWIGWLGFNGGSTTAGTPQFSHIIANTLISGAFGGLANIMIGYWIDDNFRPDRSMIGVLAGLVGITAGCDVLSTWSAVIVGFTSGSIALLATEIIEHKFKIDDAVAAFPVHGAAGAWGTIILAFLMDESQLATESRFDQVLVQCWGVLLCAIWTFTLAYLFFKILDKSMPNGLRVSEDHERMGLNEAEHGTSLGTGELLRGMQSLASDNIMNAEPLDDSSGDESGELAKVFNRIVTNLKAQNIESLRIKFALDHANTPMLVTDSDLNILFLNENLEHYLTSHKKILPSFFLNQSVDSMIGLSATHFFPNPDQLKEVLSNITGSYRQSVEFSDRIVSLTSSPIENSEGKNQGFIIEWQDLTDEEKIKDEITHMVQAASEGDFSQSINLEGKEGFFLEMGQALNRLSSVSCESLEGVVSVLKSISDGNLTQKLEGKHTGQFGQLQKYINSMVSQLTDVVTIIRNSVSIVEDQAEEVVEVNAKLNANAQEQVGTLSSTTDDMASMKQSVKDSLLQVDEVNSLSEQAHDAVNQGNESMTRLTHSMSDILTSSKQAGEITSLIDSIAFQTNLLALNAAVEAARAGEQGLGFAVVAKEVRNLSQSTANAAKEIKQLISKSTHDIEIGASLSGVAVQQLLEIKSSVAMVAEQMSNVNESAQQQSLNISNMDRSISEVNHLFSTNISLINKTVESSNKMRKHILKMAKSVDFFQLQAASSGGKGLS